jgi:hypothetical protein
MALRPADFESAAYTSSATWAFAATAGVQLPDGDKRAIIAETGASAKRGRRVLLQVAGD